MKNKQEQSHVKYLNDIHKDTQVKFKFEKGIFKVKQIFETKDGEYRVSLYNEKEDKPLNLMIPYHKLKSKAMTRLTRQVRKDFGKIKANIRKLETNNHESNVKTVYFMRVAFGKDVDTYGVSAKYLTKHNKFEVVEIIKSIGKDIKINRQDASLIEISKKKAKVYINAIQRTNNIKSGRSNANFRGSSRTPGVGRVSCRKETKGRPIERIYDKSKRNPNDIISEKVVKQTEIIKDSNGKIIGLKSIKKKIKLGKLNKDRKQIGQRIIPEQYR